MWADWEDPYLTLDAKYEAAQLRVFAAMVANGHIYRGRKPVHWSPSTQTALAESVRPCHLTTFAVKILGEEFGLAAFNLMTYSTGLCS